MFLKTIQALEKAAAGVRFLGNYLIQNSYLPTDFMTEPQIKDALIALLDGIKRADAQAIAENTARLDESVVRGRLGLPPQLVHFLERRSYAKALQYLEGADGIPAGTCRRPAGKGAS